MRNSDGGFTPAASHATSSSRDCNGVISIWSRAIKNPDLWRFDRTRRMAEGVADSAVRKNESRNQGLNQEQQGDHRAGTPSRTAAALPSVQEQPSRSSRPQSFMASVSDSLEPTCFSIAAE